MKYWIAVLLLLFTIDCHAEIYQQQDVDGHTIYSDIPLNNNAQKLNSPASLKSSSGASSQTTTTVATPSETQPSLATPKSIKQSYKVFLIAAPKDQETIQNQPVIPVKIDIDPPLQEGDKIQLFLDGKPWKDAVASTELQLAEVDRGIHQLSASLIDANKIVLKQSGSITIYVHHASVNSISKAQKSAQ